MKNHERLVNGIVERMKKSIQNEKYATLKELSIDCCFDELVQNRYPSMESLSHLVAQAEARYEFRELYPSLVKINQSHIK